MTRVCPKCSNYVSISGECSFCEAQEKKTIGWMGSSIITVIIIGALIAGTMLTIQTFGNPLDFINNFRPNGLYKVTQASKHLPVLRDPKETITLNQIADLRKYFETQQFGALNSILEGYQSGFEINPDDEYKVYDAFRMFAGTLPTYDDLLDSWVQFSPEHYAPYLARANYLYAKGWESRGTRFAKDTPEGQITQMRSYFRNAAYDLGMALNINPNLLPAYDIQIGIFNATGDNLGEDRSLRGALELFPSSFLIRASYIWARLPRWGGTYREMENFAKEAEQYVDIDPHHFDSYLMMDYVLLESKQWDEIIGYWNQFLNLEPVHSRAYLERAGTYYHRKDFANSLKDLKAACELGNEEGCKRFDKYKDIWN